MDTTIKPTGADEGTARLNPGVTSARHGHRGYKSTLVGMIPRDWDCVRLGDIARVSGGKRLPAGSSLVAAPTPHPYIRVSDMFFGGVSTADLRYVPDSAFAAIQDYRIYRDDIFISVAGTLGIVGVVPPELDGANLTENADRVSDLKCDRDYLKYWLMSRPIQQAIETIRTVGAQPKLALARIADFKVALPRNVDEQRAISGALSDVDSLLGALDHVIAKKRAIKQAAVEELATGKTRLPGFTRPWRRTRLGQLGVCIRGVSYDPDVDLAQQDGPDTFRLLRANNVQDASVVTAPLQFVDKRRVAPRQAMQSGDILICLANGSKDLVGKSGVLQVDDGFLYTFGAFMGCFRADRNVADPSFLHLLLLTRDFRRVLGVALAGSSINNLKPSDVENASFQVPDKAEQAAIGAVVYDMAAEIMALERRREKTLAIKQGMMQQLLTGRIRLVEPGVEGESAA